MKARYVAGDSGFHPPPSSTLSVSHYSLVTPIVRDTYCLTVSRSDSRPPSGKAKKQTNAARVPSAADAPASAEPLAEADDKAFISTWAREAKASAKTMAQPIISLFERGENDAATEALLHLLTEQNAELRRAEMRLQLARRLRFGSSSERLDRNELEQMFLAFGGEPEADGSLPENLTVNPPDPSATDVDPPPGEPGSKAEPSSDARESSATTGKDDGPTEKKPRGGGRKPFPHDLARCFHCVVVPDGERACAICGREREVLGQRTHEWLEYVPARLVVHEERREILGCRPCRGDVEVVERERPHQPVRAGHTVLAHMLLQKCDDAMPLERQADDWQRMGLDIAPSTMDRWWTYLCTLLCPLADVIIGRLLADPYIGVDDTGLKYLESGRDDKKRPMHRGHIWCFIGGSKLVGFRFTESWAAEEIAVHLRQAKGFVQGDGYAGYGASVQLENEPMPAPLIDAERQLGCLMHARRPFYEVFAAKDGRAAKPLEFIRQIYALEADFTKQSLDAVARGAQRTLRSMPIFERLAVWVAGVHHRLRPTDPLRKATTYFTNQEPFLRRLLTDGTFELDTGRVERAIREFVVARKNFGITGSSDAGKRLAVAFTVVESARRILHPTQVRPYLEDVVARLTAAPELTVLHDLVPDVWAARNPRK